MEKDKITTPSPPQKTSPYPSPQDLCLAVLLSATVERFSVSYMPDYSLSIILVATFCITLAFTDICNLSDEDRIV